MTGRASESTQSCSLRSGSSPVSPLQGCSAWMNRNDGGGAWSWPGSAAACWHSLARSSSASSGSPTRTSFPALERSCTSQQVPSLLRPHARPWRSSVGLVSSQVKRNSPRTWPMRPMRRRSRLPEFSTHGDSPECGVTTMFNQVFARSLRSARGIHNHPGRGTQ